MKHYKAIEKKHKEAELFEKIKALEVDYLDIWSANVEFKKGYRGYDEYIREIIRLCVEE